MKRLFTVLTMWFALSSCATIGLGSTWVDREGELKKEMFTEFAKMQPTSEEVVFYDLFINCFASRIAASMDKAKCEDVDADTILASVEVCAKADINFLGETQMSMHSCLEETTLKFQMRMGAQ